MGSILQQLVSTANTTVQGRYVFSGDADQTAPYSIDLTQSSPVSAYQGTATTRQIQGPDGTAFPMALTAQQIFDSSNAQTNVFASITSLMQGLQNNDDTAISSAMSRRQSSDTSQPAIGLLWNGSGPGSGRAELRSKLLYPAANAIEWRAGCRRGLRDHQHDPGSNPTNGGFAIPRSDSQNYAFRLSGNGFAAQPNSETTTRSRGWTNPLAPGPRMGTANPPIPPRVHRAGRPPN